MKMKYKSMGGLTVKDGRLINDREPGVSGIEQAARIKKSICRARRVDEIADGIELAEGRKNFYRI
tara:strand:- start:660 stop:854 length:195 start_codon:yes stop_codon:yes gene_type:complete